MSYAVFFGEVYYPDGGWNDHEGTFPTFEAAMEKLAELKKERIKDQYDTRYVWWHIVNLDHGEIVEMDPQSKRWQD